MPTLRSINVNPNGGVPKHPVESAFLDYDVVRGDKQANRRFHGGPLRAACLYSLDRIHALRDEGHSITPGSTGENLTIEGLDWNAVTPGTKLAVGEALLEVTTYTAPCQKIAGSFVRGDFGRLSQKTYPGWSRVYVKVLRSGEVKVGDAVCIEQ